MKKIYCNECGKEMTSSVCDHAYYMKAPLPECFTVIEGSTCSHTIIFNVSGTDTNIKLRKLKQEDIVII